MNPQDPGPDPNNRDEAALLQRVETMISAAGGYVDASDDLRPRVLEAARHDQTTERVRGHLGLAACAVLLIATIGGVAGQRFGGVLAAASPETRVANLQAADTAQRSGIDFCWRLVDAFVTVREEQAEALQPRRHAAAPASVAEEASIAGETTTAGE